MGRYRKREFLEKEDDFLNRQNDLAKGLRILIDEELLSIDILHNVTYLDKEVLKEYIYEDSTRLLCADDMKNSQYKLRLASIYDCLADGMKVDEDTRIIGLIDVLVQVYEMDYKMIAKYADMREEELYDFINKNNELTYEKKYKLSVKVFSLIQALRET